MSLLQQKNLTVFFFNLNVIFSYFHFFNLTKKNKKKQLRGKEKKN